MIPRKKKREEEDASPAHASLALALPGDMKWEGGKKTQRNFRTVAQAAQDREGERENPESAFSTFG